MEENTTPATDMPLIRVSASRRLMGVPWAITVHAATTAACIRPTSARNLGEASAGT